MSMVTEQELFNQIATHMLTQMRASKNERGSCAYRGRGGLKCAVGAVINDGEYDPAWDEGFGNGVDEIVLPARLVQHRNFLSIMQDVHDFAEPEHWDDELLIVAERRGLIMPDLPQLNA